VSADIQCVGVCIIDADTGVCMGCGRAPEEISGVPQPSPPPPDAAKAPLPANVAAEAANPSD
jgi:hypothetical protein